MRPSLASLVFVLFLFSPSSSSGVVLTLESALARARAKGPPLQVAREKLAETRARRVGAALALRENPVLSLAPGASLADGRLAFDASLEQKFEIGSRRAARIAMVDAAIDRASADAGNATRLHLRDVAVAFVRAVHARERVALAREVSKLAEETARATEMRESKGDATILDVKAAQFAAQKARLSAQLGASPLESALADIRALLDFSTNEPLELRGALDTFAITTAAVRVPRDRADVRAALSEAREADAETRLGQTLKWPDLGLKVDYSREEGADRLFGGVSVTLPFFQRGQAVRAEAAARARRLRVEASVKKKAITREVSRREIALGKLRNAVRTMRDEIVPAAVESERLTRAAFGVGQTTLFALLFVRRETIETRLAYLDLLFETALAAVELRAEKGDIR